MRNIVIDLFHGSSHGFDSCYTSAPAYICAVNRQEELEKELFSTLSESQSTLFRQYQRACDETTNLAAEQDFFAGYRLGMRLLLAALPDEYMHI